MTLKIYVLVLFAALLHASWNALVRSSQDKLWSMTSLFAVMGFFSLISLPFLPLPLLPSWPYLLLSVFIHIGYCFFLAKAYHAGNYTQVYPIARGVSPLLIALGALLLAKEHLSAINIVGLFLVSFGILSLSLRCHYGAARIAILSALATGLIIAAYSVVDGLGVRLSGNSMSYVAWLFVLTSILMAGAYRITQGPIKWQSKFNQAPKALGGGLAAALSYGIVVHAMNHGPMGPISALRETSVVFAVIIGALFLKERISLQRFITCVMIAVGAALIVLAAC